VSPTFHVLITNLQTCQLVDCQLMDQSVVGTAGR